MTFLPAFGVSSGSGRLGPPLSPEDATWAQVLGGLFIAGFVLWLLRSALQPAGSFSLRDGTEVTRERPVLFWTVAALYVVFALLGLAMAVHGAVAVFLWMTR